MPYRKFAICLTDIEAKSAGRIYEFNDKKYINVILEDYPTATQFGKNFAVYLDRTKEEWEKPKNERPEQIRLCEGKFQYTYQEKLAMGLIQDNGITEQPQASPQSAPMPDNDLPF